MGGGGRCASPALPHAWVSCNPVLPVPPTALPSHLLLPCTCALPALGQFMMPHCCCGRRRCCIPDVCGPHIGGKGGWLGPCLGAGQEDGGAVTRNEPHLALLWPAQPCTCNLPLCCVCLPLLYHFPTFPMCLALALCLPHIALACAALTADSAMPIVIGGTLCVPFLPHPQPWVDSLVHVGWRKERNGALPPGETLGLCVFLCLPIHVCLTVG